MRKVVYLLALTFLGGASLVTIPSAAHAAGATANGGGTGTFDMVPGLASQFGFGVTVNADGSASGQFQCIVTTSQAKDILPPGTVIPGQITGTVASGMLNPDGSVTFSGSGFVTAIPGGVVGTNIGFSVTVQSGGPGVGHFTLVVPSFGLVCPETVSTGMIAVH